MRYMMGLALLLGLVLGGAASAVATPEAPSEAACGAALRSLVDVASLEVASKAGEEADDLLRRFIDAEAFAVRVFGERGKNLPPIALRTIRSWLMDGPRDVRDRSDGSLSGSTIVGDARLIEVPLGRRKRKTVRLLWRQAPRGPLLIDGGVADGSLMSEVAAAAWQVRGGKPAELIAKLHAFLENRKQIVYSKDNLRSIVTLMIARRMGRSTGGYAPYSGKNFVLSLIATNLLDRRTPQNLEILFSPADRALSLAKVGLEPYKEITKKSLKAGMDFHALTSYAGRRNGERDWVITPDSEKVGTALVADLSFPDMALVGFTNGSVRAMDREALGLGPEDPIVVGDDSKSEILRALSDK